MAKVTKDPSGGINGVLTVSVKDSLAIAKALSTQLRIDMFMALVGNPMCIAEIAEQFNLPLSTTASNISILEEAGLIITDLVPGTRGRQKMCGVNFLKIVMDVETTAHQVNSECFVEIPMPIGNFINVSVSPTCGLVSEHSIIGEMDDVASFYEPDRTNAQLIWFHKGYLEYMFPNRVPKGVSVKSIELVMEVCSEAPFHNPDWPSDITVWINGQEIGTWTSPADFGGQKGHLTPAWWGTEQTQYGFLKTWKVSNQGSFIDGRLLSSKSIGEVWRDSDPAVAVKIGIKDDAKNVGGINLFGRRFGNYETDLMLRIGYEEH